MSAKERIQRERKVRATYEILRQRYGFKLTHNQTGTHAISKDGYWRVHFKEYVCTIFKSIRAQKTGVDWEGIPGGTYDNDQLTGEDSPLIQRLRDQNAIK